MSGLLATDPVIFPIWFFCVVGFSLSVAVRTVWLMRKTVARIKKPKTDAPPEARFAYSLGRLATCVTLLGFSFGAWTLLLNHPHDPRLDLVGLFDEWDATAFVVAVACLFAAGGVLFRRALIAATIGTVLGLATSLSFMDRPYAFGIRPVLLLVVALGAFAVIVQAMRRRTGDESNDPAA